MLTLGQVVDAMADVEALCRPRPLVTPELFPENDNYGMASILKQYADLPVDEPLRALVPHGVYLEDTRVAQGEARAPVPAVLCYPDYRAHAWRTQTDKIVVPSASPVAYAALLLADTLVREGQGSLFFPVHSTAHITTRSDDRGAVERLLADPGLPRPLRACMYWRDIELGRHRPYVDAGIQVVSAGHIADPQFVFRLLHLISWHAEVVTNALGSHVFYASHVGRPVALWHQDHIHEGDADDVARDAPALTSQREQQVRELSALLSSGLADDFLHFNRIASDHLGAQHIIGPEAMRSQLVQLKHLDRVGSILVPGVPWDRQIVPYAARRWIKLSYWSARHAIFGTLGRAKRSLLRVAGRGAE